MDVKSLPMEEQRLAQGIVQLCQWVREAKAFSRSLAKGNIDVNPPGAENELASELKNMQGNLRHLTWQVEQIAKGDYNQKVNFMGVFSDAFNRMTQQLRERTQILAFQDVQTHAHNRRFGMELLQKLCTQEERFSLAFVDIDHLRYCNDHFGHDEGDSYIVRVSEALQLIPVKKSICRMGGDEFFAILNTDKEEAGAYLNEARKKIMENTIGDAGEVAESFSYGIADNYNRQVPLQQLLDDADDELRKFRISRKKEMAKLTNDKEELHELKKFEFIKQASPLDKWDYEAELQKILQEAAQVKESMELFYQNLPMGAIHAHFSAENDTHQIWIQDFNEHMHEMLEYTKEELENLLKENPYGYIYPDDLTGLNRELQMALSRQYVSEFWYKLRFVRKDGTIGWAHMSCSLLSSEEIMDVYLLFTDISTEINMLEESRKAQNTIAILQKDSLTGLINKEAFYRMTEAVLRKDIDNKFDIAVVDVERFKLINDVYGIEAGDRLLCFIAKTLKETKTAVQKLVARADADHFFMLIKRGDDSLELIEQELNNCLQDYPLDMRISMKFGIYHVSDRNIPVQNMCDRAVLAADSIKGNFNQFVAYYDESIRQHLLMEQRIIDGMAEALKDETFQIYLQPKIQLSTEKLVGAEALVRWMHPQYGYMTPGEFLPVFEKNGFITKLDLYVWEKTCAILQEWKKSPLKNVPISVNVSRKDIYNENLPHLFLELIEKYGLEAKDLHLEITESAYTEDSKQLVHVVEHLKEEGFIIEMDDFGSGYSSLNILAELPIDILKLDMQLIQNKDNNVKKTYIMETIVELAKKMNLRVIAEGVENKSQVDLLRAMECDDAQGYYYSRPIPYQAFMDMFEIDAEKETIK